MSDRFRSLFSKFKISDLSSKTMARKNITIFFLILFSGFFAGNELFPESVAEKAQQKRNEIIGYLRLIRPMVYNFPCEPFPLCIEDVTEADKKKPKDRIAKYNEIKRIYQEGLVFFYERNFINAYNRFLDSQSRTDELLEGLSQSFLDRSSQMMQDSIEKKNLTNPEDMTVVDISLEFGPNSKIRRDFSEDREAPLATRRYNPRLFRYAKSKYTIEKNMEKGLEHMYLARLARKRAMTVDSNLARHQKIQPHHIKIRIEYYLDSVKMARLAKLNAENIFQLKYPYDNYALMNPNGKTEKIKKEAGKVPVIDGKTMNWSKNPYVLPKKLHPVFDLRLPDKYRRDAADVRNLVFTDEVDVYIKFKFYEKKPQDLKDAN